MTGTPPGLARAAAPAARRCLAAVVGTLSRRQSDDDTGRLLVLAPHPDDEVLGCGGLIAARRSGQASVRIVIATDGDALGAFGADGAPDLARRRQDESRRSAALLGVMSGEVVFLGLPDGVLARHADELLEAVRRQVLAFRPDDVLVTAPSDPHADHAALGRAARTLLAEGVVPNLLEYQVWQWRHPRAFVSTWWRANRLRRPERLDLRRHRDLKREALQQHASQLSGGADGTGWALDDRFLVNFFRRDEVYFPVRPGRLRP